jgi:murein L,D-transpeptidase YcbB/YkuD
VPDAPDASATSDVFDAKLEKRVMAFQRQAMLEPDGVVGRETLVRMALTLQMPQAPSLLRQARQEAGRPETGR